MTVRQMKYEDLLEVEQIENECFLTPWNHRMLSDTFMAEGFIGAVCEENGKIIGYGSLNIVCKEGNVNNIAVRLSERGKGCGTAILNFLIEECKKVKVESIFLEVRRSNSPALHIYRKRGFIEIAVRKNYYENGEDALVMQKKFIWGE